jgi:hypothetical protein
METFSNKVQKREVSRAAAYAVQGSFRVGKPGDSFEQEAEEVSSEVMAMPEGQVSRQPEEEEEKIQKQELPEEEDNVQASAMGNDLRTDGAWLEQQVGSTRGQGDILPESTRSFMESRMGADFNQVRIHTDDAAVSMNRSLQARAFTSGRDIYFNKGYYQPETPAGKHLIAHELTHVMQQGGASSPQVQGDFALEPPERAEGDEFVRLTAVQVRSAIWYNQTRYDRRNTMLIQDLVGTEQTGTWNEDTVQAVAMMQWEYGLTADGKVGSDTFQHLNREQEAEGTGTETENVILLFRTPSGNVAPQLMVSPTGQYFLEGHFTVEAQFQERADCGDWEYRQFIMGNAWAQRPGSAQINLNHYFTRIPGGRLPTAFQEDGNTSWAGINYGHRDQQGRGFNPINRYETADGAPDQQNGCIYRGEDYPSVGDAALRTGDSLELDLSFRGEIHRRDENGNLKMVQRRTWTVSGVVIIP